MICGDGKHDGDVVDEDVWDIKTDGEEYYRVCRNEMLRRQQ